jgi:hypothetical protein
MKELESASAKNPLALIIEDNEAPALVMISPYLIVPISPRVEARHSK